MSENKNNETKVPKRGKTNGYNSAHLHAKRNRKRQEAQSRKREHDTLTLNEKIEKARSRRGESKREIARLMKMAEAEGVTVKAQTPAAPAATAGANPKATKKVAKKAMKKVAKKKAAK